MTKKQYYVPLLSKRVTLQSLVQTADGAGGYSSSWTAVASLWAHLAPIINSSSTAGGGEVMQAMRLEDRQMVRITIRYREGVTAAMRLVMGTRVFNIRRIVNKDERNIVLELIAEEGGAV